MADLIRTAVRKRHLTRPTSRREIVQEIFRLEISIEEDWSSIEEEISRAHTEEGIRHLSLAGFEP
jgi:hypothetical protein